MKHLFLAVILLFSVGKAFTQSKATINTNLNNGATMTVKLDVLWLNSDNHEFVNTNKNGDPKKYYAIVKFGLNSFNLQVFEASTNKLVAAMYPNYLKEHPFSLSNNSAGLNLSINYEGDEIKISFSFADSGATLLKAVVTMLYKNPVTNKIDFVFNGLQTYLY